MKGPLFGKKLQSIVINYNIVCLLTALENIHFIISLIFVVYTYVVQELSRTDFLFKIVVVQRIGHFLYTIEEY